MKNYFFYFMVFVSISAFCPSLAYSASASSGINPVVPIFFVSMGAAVDITVFGNSSIFAYAFWLFVVAVIGKQICGLGVLNKEVDRIAVGLGMIPRGEVGLIFIGIGSKMVLDGSPVIDSATFGSVVIVVVVTTMITPSLIKWRFTKLTKNNL